MPLNTDYIKKYAQYHGLKKELESKANEISKKMSDMQDAIINNMLDSEVDKVNLKGGITITIDDKIFAKCIKIEGTDKVDRELIAKALKKAGLKWLISNTINLKRITSYLRELDKSGEPLPEELKGLIEPSSVPRLVVKKYK